MAWPLASTLLALSACNALTGVSELSTCPTCEASPSVDSGVASDAKPNETSVADASSPDARDGAVAKDASTDAGADAEAGLGCEGNADCIRVMFATSVTYSGNLGGIAGADAKCQTLADASSVARIRGRTFLAWVSTAASPVTTRLVHGTQSYVRADGATIALGFSDLTDGSLMNGISVDDKGGSHNNGERAWTGTSTNGAGYSGNSCTDWTLGLFPAKGDVGNVGGAGNGWSVAGSDDCTVPHSLYCVEK
jgi:hypothetical protein